MFFDSVKKGPMLLDQFWKGFMVVGSLVENPEEEEELNDDQPPSQIRLFTISDEAEKLRATRSELRKKLCSEILKNVENIKLATIEHMQTLFSKFYSVNFPLRAQFLNDSIALGIAKETGYRSSRATEHLGSNHRVSGSDVSSARHV